MRRIGLITVLAALTCLAGCGASETSGAAKPEAARTGGAAEARVTTGAEQLAGSRAEPARVEHRGAVLSVYVQGPTPIDAVTTSRAYEAELVVVNTGDTPAQVDEARARFEAWRGDRRIDCGSADLGGPVQIEPHAAHVYRATATCDVAPGSDGEIRAYLDFGADAGDLHREVHHVPSRDLHPGE